MKRSRCAPRRTLLRRNRFRRARGCNRHTPHTHEPASSARCRPFPWSEGAPGRAERTGLGRSTRETQRGERYATDRAPRRRAPTRDRRSQTADRSRQTRRGAPHGACDARHPAPGTRHSALGTRHSALGTPSTVPDTRHRLRPMFHVKHPCQERICARNHAIRRVRRGNGRPQMLPVALNGAVPVTRRRPGLRFRNSSGGIRPGRVPRGYG